jgi:hypothetical protein
MVIIFPHGGGMEIFGVKSGVVFCDLSQIFDISLSYDRGEVVMIDARDIRGFSAGEHQ